jgi:hypothetical protein
MWIKITNSIWKNLHHFVTIKIVFHEEPSGDCYNVFGLETDDQSHFLGRFVTHEEAVEFIEKFIK